MNVKQASTWAARLAIVAAIVFAVVVLFMPQGSRIHAQTTIHTPVSVTSDWSNHHLVFSAPGTPVQALRVQTDPRYVQQLRRRASPNAQ